MTSCIDHSAGCYLFKIIRKTLLMCEMSSKLAIKITEWHVFYRVLPLSLNSQLLARHRRSKKWARAMKMIERNNTHSCEINRFRDEKKFSWCLILKIHKLSWKWDHSRMNVEFFTPRGCSYHHVSIHQLLIDFFRLCCM